MTDNTPNPTPPATDTGSVVVNPDVTSDVNERRSKKIKAIGTVKTAVHHRRKAQLQTVAFDDIHFNSSAASNFVSVAGELIELLVGPIT